MSDQIEVIEVQTLITNGVDDGAVDAVVGSSP
jgi:hypothetical protein